LFEYYLLVSWQGGRASNKGHGLFAQFQAALLQRWNLPHFMCAFCPFVQVLSVNVSVFTLTAIAVDRHRAILNPLR
jgi:leucokinin receptor